MYIYIYMYIYKTIFFNHIFESFKFYLKLVVEIRLPKGNNFLLNEARQ